MDQTDHHCLIEWRMTPLVVTLLYMYLTAMPHCRLPARYSVAGGAAPRKRDSVLSRGSLPTIVDDEDGDGPGVNFGAPPPAVGGAGAANPARPRARFRESMMALILPARRRTSLRVSESAGDVPIPEGRPMHGTPQSKSNQQEADMCHRLNSAQAT